MSGFYKLCKGNLDGAKMFELEWVALALKGVFTASLGYITQQVLKKGQEKLESLQSLPLEQTDENLEEVLGHFVELAQESGDVSSMTTREGFRIIRSGAASYLTYFYLKAVELPPSKPRDEKEGL